MSENGIKIILYRNAFKDVSIFDSILKALNSTATENIILKVLEEKKEIKITSYENVFLQDQNDKV